MLEKMGVNQQLLCRQVVNKLWSYGTLHSAWLAFALSCDTWTEAGEPIGPSVQYTV